MKIIEKLKPNFEALNKRMKRKGENSSSSTDSPKKKNMLLMYSFDLLIRNKLMIVLIVSSILVNILVPVLLVYSDPIIDFARYSYILILIPAALILLNASFAAIILFSNTKGNNVDLYLYTTTNKKITIVFKKQLAILFLLSFLLVSEFIKMIVFSIVGIPIEKSFVYFCFALMSFFILSFIWIIIFTYFSVMLKQLTSTFLIITSSIILIGSLFLPLLIPSSETFSNKFDIQKNQRSIVKVLNIDDSGKVINSMNTIYSNPSADVNNSLDSSVSSFLTNLPTVSLLGPSIFMPSSVYEMSQSELSSFGENKVNGSIFDFITNVSWYDDNKKMDNIILAPLSTKTIWEYHDKNLLYQNILKEFNSSDDVKKFLDKPESIEALKNNLKSSLIWGNSIDEDSKKIIEHLLGLADTNSLSYEIFKNYELAVPIVDKFYDFIEKKYSSELKELIKFLWTDHVVKQNVFSYNSLSQSSENINYKHPIISGFDESQKANNFDIDLMKNKLFHVSFDSNNNIENIQVLTKSNVYKNISDYESITSGNDATVLNFVLNTDISKKIETKADYENYLNTYLLQPGNSPESFLELFAKYDPKIHQPQVVQKQNLDDIFSITESGGKIQSFKYKNDDNSYENIGPWSKKIPKLRMGRDIQIASKIFGTSISNKEQWDDAFVKNETVLNLNSIISKLNILTNNDSETLFFRDNINDSSSIRQLVELGVNNKFNLMYVYLFIFILISVGAEFLVFMKMKKKDVI